MNYLKGIFYTVAAIVLLLNAPLVEPSSTGFIVFFVFVHLALLILGVMYLIRAVKSR